MKSSELAKRWAESKFWGGWRKGMVDEHGDVVHDTWPDGSFCTSELVDGDDWHRTPERATHEAESGLTPDLTHPGTLAFLLEDVRAAWGDIVTLVLCESGSTHCNIGGLSDHAHFANTMGEALIAALEAAP